MKILSIGNSFSQDAQRYLNGIALAAGKKCKNMNLYIGGCALATHFKKIFGDEAAYGLEYRGEMLNLSVSARQVILSDSWDIITVQQASRVSCDFKTMEPYIKKIVDEVRFLCPSAKVYIHRTWGYETGSSLLAETGFSTMAEMDAAVKSAYAQAMKFVGADGIIPSGDAMLALSLAGIGRAHRDGFHASLGMGRYTLALTWFESIFGESCIGNSFRDFDEEISEDAVTLCQRIAAEAVRGG